MLRRLILGLILGLAVGAAIAAGLVKGVGLVAFGGPLFAYLGAVATGAATGLVAGKPIWSADGKIEAGLKAFVGALLAAGATFALRRWVHVPVDLGAIGAGSGPLHELPATALPLVGGALGALFELDNDGKGGASKGSGARVATGDDPTRARIADALDEEEEASPRTAERRKR